MIDFLCIGAQKSGTTLLYEHLKNIDGIFLPERKELHFFDNVLNYNRGLNYYYDFFKEAREEQIKGEVTPAYLFFDEVPRRIKKTLDSDRIKFIVILRNPVDRAYSQYNMSHSLQGHEKMSFEHALIYENYRLHEYSDYVNYTYLSRGFYTKQILNYFKYFKRDQFKFILFEEFNDNQKNKIYEIVEFLGLEIEFGKLDIEHKIIFSNNYEEMNYETRRVLMSIYKEEITALENILDIDLSIWRLN